MLRKMLLSLAQSSRLQQWITGHNFTAKAASRFIAGETLADAMHCLSLLNREKFTATIDYLGEATATDREAVDARNIYCAILDSISSRKLDANISVKLSQLGLEIGEEFCLNLLRSLVKHAEKHGNFVRVDMEGSRHTEATLRIVKQLRQESSAVGAVVQAYLYRSENDINELLKLGCRVRLCKGAYLEGANVAFQKKSDVDANFIKLTKRLLASGIYHGIATHDPKMIGAAIAYAQKHRIPKTSFEFQMLYGIRRDRQEKLRSDGYTLRIYVPFGPPWFEYFMRRLAERPANLTFFLRNIFR